MGIQKRMFKDPFSIFGNFKEKDQIFFKLSGWQWITVTKKVSDVV